MERSKFKAALFSMRDRNNLFLLVKIIVLIFSTLALFSKDFTAIFSDALQSEVTSHILLVPFIFSYMLYRKRNMLRAMLPLENNEKPTWIRYTPTITAILLITTSLVLYWYGSFTFTPLEYHLLALPVFVAGSTLLLFNFQTLRQLALPITFLFFLVPPPSEVLFNVGATLSMLSAMISSAISNAFGINSVLLNDYENPTIQITQSGGTVLNFAVDIACSGIYSLIGFLIIATLIAYMIRDKPLKKFALVLIGVPIIYLFNVLRITTIIVIGYNYGETLALEVFHLLGGWVLMFIGTILLLLISEKVLRTQIFSKKDKCPQCLLARQISQIYCSTCGRILKHKAPRIHKTGISKVIALLITVVLIVVIQAPVFALTQTPAEVLVTTSAGQQLSTDILPKIPGYTLQFDYRDTDFEELAKIDAAILYLYVPSNHSEKHIWVAIEIGAARSLLHRWESCLIKYPLIQGNRAVTQIDLHDVTLLEDPPIIGRFFAFQYPQTGQLKTVLYWYESASFNVNSTIQQKHVKISLIVYPNSIEEKSQNEDLLLELADSIVEYWRPIKLWSPVALILSQNGGQLTVATILLLVATFVLYGLEVWKQKQLFKTVYSKLSKTDKLLIDVIRKTAKTKIPTVKNIVETYREFTGQSKDETELLHELAELENLGLIKSTITSIEDEPIQIWKT